MNFTSSLFAVFFSPDNIESSRPYWITNDAVVLGLLLVILAIIFQTSSSSKPFWQKFYTYIPSLLLCYFIPGLLNWPLHWVDGNASSLYFVASRYLLPASLVLLCLSIDFQGIRRLGPKALIMFFAATLGIVLGGPIAILLIKWLMPNLIQVDMDQLWRGMSTIAGSWIGGGANQTAMKEIFLDAHGNPTLEQSYTDLFSKMILVDVLVANIWMGILLYWTNKSDRVDRFLKADNSAIKALEKRMSDYQESVKKIPTTSDTILLLAVAFGGVAMAHFVADWISPILQSHMAWLQQFKLHSLASQFFWLVVVATTIGVAISFTDLRKLEGVGATRMGSIFIYLLVATIGLKINLREVFNNPELFLLGFIWMLVHIGILLLVAKLIKAPFFFVAVGSQANVGGAASAPIVASAFNPSLASVGILMAVLGYALGTYGAILCAFLMQSAAL